MCRISPTFEQSLHGFDAIISAFSGHAQSNTLDYYVAGMRNIIDAAKAVAAPRLLVVGGAGSLEVAPAYSYSTRLIS